MIIFSIFQFFIQPFYICYQMLGRTVSDPEQVESAGVTEINGLGLLEMDTEFRGEKVQTQTRGVFHGVEGLSLIHISCGPGRQWSWPPPLWNMGLVWHRRVAA